MDLKITGCLEQKLNSYGEIEQRRIRFLLQDFEIQRKNSLQNLIEEKNSISKSTDFFYKRLKSQIPRRVSNLTIFNLYKTEDGLESLIAENKKEFKCRKKDILSSEIVKKYYTPVKYKVTYTGTKKRSSIRHSFRNNLEIKRFSTNGLRLIASGVGSVIKCEKPKEDNLEIDNELESSFKNSNDRNESFSNLVLTDDQKNEEDEYLKLRNKKLDELNILKKREIFKTEKYFENLISCLKTSLLNLKLDINQVNFEMLDDLMKIEINKN